MPISVVNRSYSTKLNFADFGRFDVHIDSARLYTCHLRGQVETTLSELFPGALFTTAGDADLSVLVPAEKVNVIDVGTKLTIGGIAQLQSPCFRIFTENPEGFDAVINLQGGDASPSVVTILKQHKQYTTATISKKLNLKALQKLYSRLRLQANSDGSTNRLIAIVVMGKLSKATGEPLQKAPLRWHTHSSSTAQTPTTTGPGSWYLCMALTPAMRGRLER